MIYDDTQCLLGEGPLWHPERQQFFWFDVLGCRLHTKGQQWQFDEIVSAAGWVDADTLLIASETQLFTFNLATGTQEKKHALEADNPGTRSNDGRADPQGGFWIGTMGKDAEADAGAIYRAYKGELRMLFPNITIPNAICFAPDGKTAYFTDSQVNRLMATDLDTQGWPTGTPRIIVDASGADFAIDGAVVAADGTIWNAQWGAARIVQYSPDGSLLSTIPVAAKQSSCPAFGGADLSTLFCTSAAVGLNPPGADDGKTFAIPTKTKGQAEHRVLL